jgi:hypothetical protein
LKESLARGICWRCGKQIPEYRPLDTDWLPPEDWSILVSGGTLDAWVCPDCAGDPGQQLIGAVIERKGDQ